MTIPALVLVLLSIPILIETFHQRNVVFTVVATAFTLLYLHISILNPPPELARDIVRFTLAFILGALDGDIIWRRIKHANRR